MKIWITILFFLSIINVKANDIIEDPNLIINEMFEEIKICQSKHYFLLNQFEIEISDINNKIFVEKRKSKQIQLLLRKEQLKVEIDKLNIQSITNISKIRYIKGIQIIRILYEKVLSLDHHFAAVRTFSEISKIANPNQYPEFDRLKTLIKNNKDDKDGVDLTGLLGTNTIVSVVNTFSNLVISNLDKNEKEEELTNIECILDFTLRMQNDLNTIYYETSFLQSSNESIKEELESLFREYTKPISYTNSISDCRLKDDWDNLNSKLDDYLDKMAKTTTPSSRRNMNVNLDFTIDRLIQFISRYNGFINEGEKFYQKFYIILNSYENEKHCESKIPIEFNRLKSDIDIAIEKFSVAYRPIEVNGTKMKEILYGINEYE